MTIAVTVAAEAAAEAAEQKYDEEDDKDDKDKPAEWKSVDGYMEVVKGKGAVHSKEAFGDVQLHIEWMAPSPAEAQENSSIATCSPPPLPLDSSGTCATFAEIPF